MSVGRICVRTVHVASPEERFLELLVEEVESIGRLLRRHQPSARERAGGV